MDDAKVCPFCGLRLARRLSQVSATCWRYRCAKCKKVFIVDESTGEIVK
ncbi:MAG: hypothetical protein KBS54_02150 [Synergistaceae bacterium]|nr:hypothetical protein [Candidatus Equadaptatus faecalis]